VPGRGGGERGVASLIFVEEARERKNGPPNVRNPRLAGGLGAAFGN